MFISFGVLSYKLLIPLLYPILYQVRRFILHKDTNPFYEVIMDFFSYSIGGFVLILIKYNTQHKTEEEKEREKEKEKEVLEQKRSNSDINLVDNQILIDKNRMEKIKKRKQHFFIFILSCVNLIPMAVEPYYIGKIYILLRESIGILFAIFFYVLLSRIILGVKIYTHQYVSLLVLILCLVTIFILDVLLCPVLPSMKEVVQTTSYFFTVFGCYALFDVSGKRYFNVFLDDPYHLMFFVGIMSLCLFVPYDVFMFFVFPEKTHLHGAIREIINLMSPWYPLIFLADVVIGFLWLGGIWLTIYYFTPCHFIISESLSQLITSIISWRLEKDYYAFQPKLVYISLFIVMIFAAMVYNEVIILNFFGLNRDTKVQIDIREKMESLAEDDKEYSDKNQRNSHPDELNMELNTSNDNTD